MNFSPSSVGRGPARDFVGYGQHPPSFRWPGDALIAINIVLNYEEGAEYSLLDGDPINDTWGEYSYEIPPTVRDMGTETHMEFGSRVGVWRMIRLFEEYKVPFTVDACALALERNPEFSDWVRHSACDVMGHSYRWTEDSRMSRDEERASMRRAIDSLTHTTGQRVRGWVVRSFPSVNTRELLVEEGGFLYDSDASNDEIPYFVDVNGTQFLVVPYSKVYNDVRYLIAPTYSTPNDFYENLRLALDYMLGEAERGYGSRMLTVGLHTRWSGQASRASAVRRFLDYAQSKANVTFMRRLDIAQYWIDTFGTSSE